MSDLLARLDTLSAQRTARTDALLASTHALLSRLDEVTEVGDSAEVDGCTLERVRRSSNVGSAKFWKFERTSGTGCMLDSALDSDRYLHGDFGCRIAGPTRGDLIAFALRARDFVAAIVAAHSAEVHKLDVALAEVAAATPGACEVSS